VTFDEAVAALRHALPGSLPGAEAHEIMAPRPREGWKPGVIPAGARAGAVLVLLYPVEGVPHVLLTVRGGELPHHAGQVGLPGGGLQEGETPLDAALREAEEEVGLAPEEAEVLGELTPLHIPVSGFALHPLVAVAPRRPRLEARPGEVSRILEVALSDLGDPMTVRMEGQGPGGADLTVPLFRVAGEVVWGATAIVLSELLCLLGEPPRPRPTSEAPPSAQR
jgi:8-oxo-dGTP pyrophosphatase MutT (NUDIX family)